VRETNEHLAASQAESPAFDVRDVSATVGAPDAFAHTVREYEIFRSL
jgi:hypothetical protein